MRQGSSKRQSKHLRAKTARHKSRARKRHQQQIVLYTLCCLGVLLFALVVATLVRPTQADNYHKGRETVHEQIGQGHFPSPELSDYQETPKYTEETNYSTVAVDPVFRFTHFIFDRLLLGETPMPSGYIVVTEDNTLSLGSKVENNEWRDLLARYWLSLFWVIFLLVFIILMPCIGVCYCCFCCCRRCSRGCPACDAEQDKWMRCCCGFVLVLLIIGLILGILIAFYTNILLNIGLQHTSATMKRGSEDTCAFIKDISDHIEHLFVKNYGEMETHLCDLLENAHTHLFLDLMDVSEANAAFDLERILDNMEEARVLMRQVDKLVEELRFLGAQLRDGVRGVKRDLIFALSVLCGSGECLRFLKHTEIQELDASMCLHFDQLPDTKAYLEAMGNIIDSNVVSIPEAIIERLQQIGKWIKEAVEPVAPPLIRDLHNGEQMFRKHAKLIQNVTDAVISLIHLNTLRSTKSFEDVYEKFGSGRHTINVIVCALLTIIPFVLIIALICGCCGPQRRSYNVTVCSKGSGAACLLLAIVLIFCIFSLVTLVGLFYFIMGLTTYQGACEPLKDYETNLFFHQLDATIDLTRYAPKGVLKQRREGEEAAPPLRMSTAIHACRVDQTIFELLKENDLFDFEELINTEVINDRELVTTAIFPEDIDKFVLITEEERKDLTDLSKSLLSTYHSAEYTQFLCTKLTPVDLPTMISQIKSLESRLYSQWGYYDWTKNSLINEALNLQIFHDELVDKIQFIMSRIKHKLLKIDQLILYNGNPFGESIEILHGAIVQSEDFIRFEGEEYIIWLRANLTYFIHNNIYDFMDRLVENCLGSVGKCAPLSYIYYRGVDLICHRLVDPMNGFWVGILLCSLLLLPVLFVAHRLLCLYNKIYPPETSGDAVVENSCPVCTGGAFVLTLAFNEMNESRTEGGSSNFEQEGTTEVLTLEPTTSSDVSKHKQE